MASLGGDDDDAGIVSKQPQLVLPRVKVDVETNSPKSSQIPSMHVDSALLELVRDRDKRKREEYCKWAKVKEED